MRLGGIVAGATLRTVFCFSQQIHRSQKSGSPNQNFSNRTTKMKTTPTSLYLPRNTSKAAQVALLALALTFVSQAATVTSWNYETLTTTSSLAPTGGEAAVAAFNMNGGVASLGGVSFSGASGNSFHTSGPITMAYSVPGVAWATGATGFYSANTVLNSGEYTSQNNGTLEFSGLTVGQNYTFQFILADSRAGGPDGRKVQIVGSTVNGATVTGSSSQLRYAYQGQEQYGVISATFTADSAKAAFMPQVFASNGTTAVGTQVNAIHIMAVPEPSSAALLGGLGLLALLRRRR